MNDFELKRIIDFLDKTRAPFLEHVPDVEPDPHWNIAFYMLRARLANKPVSISALADASCIPYATAMRKVHGLIEKGLIEKASRTASGKSFDLVLSEGFYDGLVRHARAVKQLLAQTFGRNNGDDEEEYYFGGTFEPGLTIPPLVARPGTARSGSDLRFLLHDDNYFASMRNMWIDFRSNLASRRNFELLDLPRLHARLLENGARDVSDFDVVAVNIPWLGELASRGLVRPIDALVDGSNVNVDDFHPTVWRTGAWAGGRYALPIYVTIESFVARRDLFERRNAPMPRSFADVLQSGRALHAPERNFYGITWNAARGMPVAHAFMFFLAACGGSILTARRNEGRLTTWQGIIPAFNVTIDTPAAHAALAYMQDLLAISPPGILNFDWNRSRDEFMAGRAAMAYVWTMRAALFEYDSGSKVRGAVAYLPHPSGPAGSVTPLGGFALAIPANLPQERADRAIKAISWMTSPEAMKAHVKNGFPVAPRFSVAADPEAAATSPIVRYVDTLAKRNHLHTWQRPAVPEYTGIEAILGEEIHDALSGHKTFGAALASAQQRAESLFQPPV